MGRVETSLMSVTKGVCVRDPTGGEAMRLGLQAQKKPR
jgi:hypothetical protein